MTGERRQSNDERPQVYNDAPDMGTTSTAAVEMNWATEEVEKRGTSVTSVTRCKKNIDAIDQKLID